MSTKLSNSKEIGASVVNVSANFLKTKNKNFKTFVHFKSMRTDLRKNHKIHKIF